MLRYLGYACWAFVILVVVAVAHYTLPQNDIVRIVATDTRRVDLGQSSRMFWSRADAGLSSGDSRDVRFIEIDPPERQPDGLPQRGYRLGLAALLQVRFGQPAGARAGPRLDQRQPAMGGDPPLRLAQPAVLDLPERGRHHPGGGARTSASSRGAW